MLIFSGESDRKWSCDSDCRVNVQVFENYEKSYFSGRGYTAGVGEPMALFYKEIGQVYPHAKFILTTR